jgi:phospholipase/carboxylesterase
MPMYRALRRQTQANALLYPLTPVLAPVSRLFLEPDQRENVALLRALAEGAMVEGDPDRPLGVVHAGNERDERGGFSLFVPENYTPDREWPLIVACHGGSGHGSDFLWSWVREARTRGCILIAPTSVDRTWSIMEPRDDDAPNLLRIVEFIGERYRLDRERMLLTGMSDGGTYTLLAGLSGTLPFTHLAPFSGVLHPLLLDNGGMIRAAGMPVYLVHGVLDWMFSVERARMAAELLGKAGAQITYREIEDLSHTYARDENAAVLDWMDVPAPAAAG